MQADRNRCKKLDLCQGFEFASRNPRVIDNVSYAAFNVLVYFNGIYQSEVSDVTNPTHREAALAVMNEIIETFHVMCKEVDCNPVVSIDYHGAVRYFYDDEEGSKQRIVSILDRRMC